MLNRHWVAIACLLLSGALPTASARAETVTLVSSSYLVGTATAVESNALSLSGPGRLEVKLTDLVWPQALAELSFAIVDAVGTSFGAGGGGSTQAFDLTAGNYFLLTSARAPAVTPETPWGSGRYGVLAAFSPALPAEVPLPPAIALLGSALACALGLRRRTTNVALPAIRL